MPNNTYRDTRGLLIGGERIDEMLSAIGRSEDQVREFLGDELSDTNGMFHTFIGRFEDVLNWLTSRASK